MILLTGATGFVGSHVLTTLKENNVRVVIRDTEENCYQDSYSISNLDGTTNWDKAFHNIDVIIHLAGLAHNPSFTRDDYFAVNTDGAYKLAHDAAKAGVKRFVFISSIGVHGSCTNGQAFNEKSEVNLLNDYTESKYRAEQKLIELSKNTGMEVVIIRPPLVYGHNAPGNFGSLTKLVSKVICLPFGLCNNKRSFISVGNLSSFLKTCAFHPKAAGETFVISESNSVSTREFTNAISRGLGTTLFQLPLPIFFMKVIANVMGKGHQATQLLGDLEVDSSKARNVLGWTQSESMQEAMDKLKEQRQL